MKFKKKVVSVIMSTTIALQILGGVATKVFAEENFNDKYSKAAIVSDLDSGRIIYSKNANNKYAMASMSKIMTLLLAFDAIKEGFVKKTDIVDIKSEDVNREGTNIKLNAGDKISLDELMKGMMTVSANDAALAIARYVGKSTPQFVSQMNKKAREIGMTNTIFYNPNGLPYKVDKNGVSTENTTTPQDVLTLSKWIYTHYPNELTAITSIKRYVNKAKKIDEPNTNPLLPLMSNVDGLKTGFTDKAGYCLSYTMKIDKSKDNEVKNRIFGVTMGAESKDARKDAAYTTLNFINKNYYTKLLYDSNTVIRKVPINDISILNIGIENKKPIVIIKKKNEILNTKIVYHKLNVSDMFKKPIATMYYYDQNKYLVAKENLYLQLPNEMDYKEKFLLFFAILKGTINDDKDTKKSPIITLDTNKLINMVKYKLENSKLIKEYQKFEKNFFAN